MRVALTGASGFIGSALVRHLTTAGHTVLRVGRARSGEREAPDVVWDAERTIEAPKLEGVDAVVHLAGEPIAQRWSEDTKRAILQSRKAGTGLIARALAALDRKPSVLVSTSATGIYGDRGNEALNEWSSLGSGFLPDVARAWEQAADPARAAGIRVVHPRIGIVLHPDGGALEKMVPIFSLGGGGKIGSGEQWMSWIARTDLIAALTFLLTTTGLDGPVNLTAPNPVTNADFTAVLGRVLNRPAVIPVPEFAIKLLYGEMGERTVIEGQRVLPDKLLKAGFAFVHPTLEAALHHELGR